MSRKDNTRSCPFLLQPIESIPSQNSHHCVEGKMQIKYLTFLPELEVVILLELFLTAASFFLHLKRKKNCLEVS